MSKIPDHKKIVLMNIPGTHDSAAFNMFCLGSCFAKTQDLDIPQQLRIGVRMFDIRVTIDTGCCCNTLSEKIENDTDLICCHGICNCFHVENNSKKKLTYKDILTQIREFLIEYPTEGIIMRTDSGRGENLNNLHRSTAIFSKIVGDVNIYYNENLTMGDIRGKIVNLTRLSERTNTDGINIFNTRIDKGTNIMETHRRLTGNNLKYDEFKVGGDLKVLEIKEMMKNYSLTMAEVEEEHRKANGMSFPLNYETSCTGEFTRLIALPKHEADTVNKFLKTNEFKKGYYYGWIAVDFIDEEITTKIINTNFSE